MGEAKRKRELISVLIPERGRPMMLFRLIKSLLETAGDDKAFEVLVAIDDDDPAWATMDGQEIDGRVRYFVWPRPKTLGEKLNMLAAQAKADTMFMMANDYVMLTHGWPGIIREAVAALPNGIGVPFPKDSLHPDHASFPIITRRMMDAIGYFAPVWFPYWYVDTWWDEIGLLLGVRPEIAVEVSAPEGRGKSQGLRDVTFWAMFFHQLRRYRVRDARGLAWKAWGKDSPQVRAVDEMIPSREALCAARNGILLTPEFAAHWEGKQDLEPTPDYASVKTFAANMMDNIAKEQPRQTKVMIVVPSGRTWEATTANDIAALSAYSAQAGITLAFLNLQTSQISIARNNSVKIALDTGVDYIMWLDSDMSVAPDTLVRLLAHNLPVTGAVYNKRVPRPGSDPETFETLGRFMPRSDEPVTDGLVEAMLMPGGVMLVHTDVYRSLHWPWYAESYRWAPDLDGLSAFKKMMKEYLGVIPTDDTLASIDGTAFGEWLATGYQVGDNGVNSEDYFFCNKARQAGYKIFCDLGVTDKVGHIGQRVVTCRLPENVVRLAAE